MSIGSRIKRFRQLRNFTQKELGVQLGYSERNADIRVAQYETGKRTPKEGVVNEIAFRLDVSPEAIKIPDIETYHGFLFTLFEFEELFGLTIDKVDDMPYLRLDKDPATCNSSAKEMLDDWYNYKSKLDSGEISMEEYAEWKATWPEMSDILLNRKPSNRKIKK